MPLPEAEVGAVIDACCARGAMNFKSGLYRPRFLGHRIEAYAAMAAV